MALVRARVGAVAGTFDGGRVSIAIRGEVGERDLEALGRALWAARTRAFLRAAGAEREPAAHGWRERAYVAGRAGIVACGRSRDGALEISVTGMRRWRVRAAPGDGVCHRGRAGHGPEVRLVGRVGERAVEEAAAGLLADQAAQIRALKRTIWQPRDTLDARGGGRP